MNWYVESKFNGIRSMKLNEVKRFLQDFGCQFMRQGKGSHEIWSCPNTSRPFALPTHRQFDPQQLLNILRSIGLSVPDFNAQFDKAAQFTPENTQQVNTPTVNVQPYEPIIQEAVEELKAQNPQLFEGVNQINVDMGFGQLGFVSSDNPADISINFQNIKDHVSRQLGQAFDQNDDQHVAALKNAVKEVIIHEQAHVGDYDPEAHMEGGEPFPGGESVAEKAQSDFVG